MTLATSIRNTLIIYSQSEQLDLDEILLTSWQGFLRAEGKSPKTIKGYLESVRRLLAFTRAQGMPSLARLIREHVAAWMVRQRGAAPTDADVRVRQRLGWAQAFLPSEAMAPPQRKQLWGVGVRPRRRGRQRRSRPC